jgi:hypothetical protein
MALATLFLLDRISDWRCGFREEEYVRSRFG